MRDIFDEIFTDQPLDPVEAARRTMRAPLHRRFYRDVTTVEGEGGWAVRLDGRPIRTPARRTLATPTQPPATAIAHEWEAQQDAIDPARMPLTRLANTIIDGVSEAIGAVKEEVGRYLGSDLMFYRAEQPEGLVARQAQHWDPVLDWAHAALGARFILSQGIMFVAQPERAVASAHAAVPDDPWRLGAVHSITTLTGSALLALALLRCRLSAEDVWAAAHVDEDWNMAQWGQDELAMQRRAFRWEEMRAAATILQSPLEGSR